MTAQLAEQFAESAKLEGEIKKNLAGLGFELMALVDKEANA
jgi:type I restriction enzyme M protein